MTDAPLETRATYQEIAAAYEQRQFTLAGSWVEDVRTRFATSLPRGAVLADIGCGPAFDTAIFAELGLRTIGFDFSRGMLSKAQNRQTALVECDMRALPVVDDSLDAIWSSYALLHIPAADLPSTIAGLARALKHGGAVCLLFAAGAAPTSEPVTEVREPVDYAPELFRTYVYVNRDAVLPWVAAAGLMLDDTGSTPGAGRGGFWVRAHKT